MLFSIIRYCLLISPLYSGENSGVRILRTLHRLNALDVKNAKGAGRLSDGGGLYLSIAKGGSKSWVYMWTKVVGCDLNTGKKLSKRYEMGLGSFPAVSLADARDRAQQCRTEVANGFNPIEERRRLVVKNFGQVADEYIETIRAEWSNDKHEYQWRQTLNIYCASIRIVPVSEISTEDVLRVLKPIWENKHETASRTRARIERVIDYATAKGWRSGENPARWRGHLRNVLPGKKRGEKSHLSAMDFRQLPDFMADLRKREGMAALALEFTILTAARTSETILAQWDEIDFQEQVWTVPASRMKMRRVHRVPLSKRCIELLQELNDTRLGNLIFPGQNPTKPLSNMAMNMLLRRMEITNATVHGFRSAFRDWCGDETVFPREVAEAALAHKVGSDVEAAYRRSDALEKRRRLMEAWAAYGYGKEDHNVVTLHA